ncbi:MAG: tape measure protein, partial [Coriobacteriia bacterium]|nr:tape measure protein [Coriobacteriia bacterium]
MADGQVVIEITGDPSGYNNAISSIFASTQSLGSKIESAGKGLTKAGAIMTAGITAPLALMGKKLVSTGLDFLELRENATVAFTTMLGSADKAQQMLSDLYAFAKTTPFKYEGILEASQTLIAMGMDAKQVIPTLTAIGDAAAATGKGQEGFNQISEAIGRMAAGSNASLQELRMLENMGIPAVRHLANAAGVSVDEMTKAISNGSVDSQWAINALVKGIEEGSDGMAGSIAPMGGLMADLKNTFMGAKDSMTTAWRNLALAFIGENENMAGSTSDVLDAVTPMVQQITSLINDMARKFRESGTTIIPIVEEITGAIRWLADQITSLSPGQINFILKAILALAAAGPILTMVGTGLQFIGKVNQVVGKAGSAITGFASNIKTLKAAQELEIATIQKSIAARNNEIIARAKSKAAAAKESIAASRVIVAKEKENLARLKSAQTVDTEAIAKSKATIKQELDNIATQKSIQMKNQAAIANSKAAVSQTALSGATTKSTAAIVAQTVAQKAMNAAMAVGPMLALTLALGAITVLANALKDAKERSENFTKATKGLEEATAQSVGPIQSQTTAIDGTAKAATNARTDLDALIKKQAELVDKITETNKTASENIGVLQYYRDE